MIKSAVSLCMAKEFNMPAFVYSQILTQRNGEDAKHTKLLSFVNIFLCALCAFSVAFAVKN
jgi:hypothetical protein